LREALRIALQEMAWIYEEEARIAQEQPGELERFREVIPHAKERQQEAASDYHFHLAKHRCASELRPGEMLKDQLDRARATHLSAAARFDLLINENHGGMQEPDGSFLLQQAGKQMRSALRRYMTCLNRYSEFQISGTVPPDVALAEDTFRRR